MVEGLRPPALDELGLDGAVHQLARRLATPAVPAMAPDSAGTIEATVQLNGQPELPAATEVAAFRITQEALTNAIRHANASHVIASITVEDDELVVRVRDNGNGLAGSRDDGVALIGHA